MGYAHHGQIGEGIHLRTFARAFVVGKEEPLDPSTTACFVTVEALAGSDIVNSHVLERLEELHEAYYNTTAAERRPPVPCTLQNLVVSSTHTHSANGGFHQYIILMLATETFQKVSWRMHIESIAQALFKAYTTVEPGSIKLARGILAGNNLNRSPTSYWLNPLEERKRYESEGNLTDHAFTQLSFHPSDNQSTSIGTINWYAVHPTNMNNSNHLISGDNKGYASYLMEKENNPGHSPGSGRFVAAFPIPPAGDCSPNLNGPICSDTGLPCDLRTSTCNGRSQQCMASGPGKDMFESTKIVGGRQYEKAKELFELGDEEKTVLSGPVDYRHAFVRMKWRKVQLDNGTTVRTCPAALGYGFAAGTTDGPGVADFAQGDRKYKWYWKAVTHFWSFPTQEQIACQHPKPILLNPGELSFPMHWEPHTVPISILRIGQIFILAIPGEFTTMSGRRLRAAVKEVLASEGNLTDAVVIASGISNAYTHYVTTFEEYHEQRYEGGSTLFGPHTLSGYIQEFRRLARDIIYDRPTATDPAPTEHLGALLVGDVTAWYDTEGWNEKFGSVVVQSKEKYRLGDRVEVKFRSANPRHDWRPHGTFLTVERKIGNGDDWQPVYTDGDWCTIYIHKFNSKWPVFNSQYAEISWTIPEDTAEGTYRICHMGTSKSYFGGAREFQGCTSSFMVMDGT